MSDAFAAAKGGTLFLDEAYALAGAGNGGDRGRDSFAADAISTLLTEAENHRSSVTWPWGERAGQGGGLKAQSEPLPMDRISSDMFRRNRFRINPMKQMSDREWKRAHRRVARALKSI